MTRMPNTSIRVNEIIEMKKVQYLILCAIGFIGIACNEDYPEVGSDFFDEVSFEVVTWDTVTMKMSTVYFDSTVTNSPTRLLVGEVTDEDFGTVTVDTYFNLTPVSTESIDDFDELSYDYTSLTLYYDGYSIGDTSSVSLEVYILQDEMEADDDGRFYNFSTLDMATDDSGIAVPIATIEFSPEPFQEDSIEIIINDEFATEIFQLYASDFESDEFLDLVPGLVIKTSAGSAVVGFTTAPKLNIYYYQSSELAIDQQTIAFTVSDQTLAFNHISSDYGGTTLENIEEAIEIDPDDKEQLYIEGGLGLALKIELPYLEQIVQSDDQLLLDQVTIELALGNDLPVDFSSLENGIELFRVDDKNNIIDQYEPYLVWNYEIEFDSENEFEIDITTFVNEQLAITAADNDDALLVRIPTDRYSSTLDQIIINNQGGGNNDSKIKLNVIKIK